MKDNQEDDVMITVTTEYIRKAPDLQMRMFIRSLLENDYGVSNDEKIKILHDEADRFQAQLPPEDAHEMRQS